MKFDKNLHQKVRYEGQLYVVILEEFPAYHKIDKDQKIVLHPIGNEWIVRITNPQVRQQMEVRKGDSIEVSFHTKE